MTNESSAREALREAIHIAGGQTALARVCAKACGREIKQGHVYYWLKAGAVPPEHAPAIDSATGVSRNRLCPSIRWDKPATSDDPRPRKSRTQPNKRH